MATQTEEEKEDLLYPDSDGKPMADNTLQFEWIVRIQGNLDDQYRDDPKVLVVGDLLWYAVRGEPTECTAPDTMVVFGRPKGYRGSYRQWNEDGVAPQVVFEVLSPNNTDEEMDRKLAFFDRHGVEEYYLYDPDAAELFGWLRRARRLRPIAGVNGWVSPRLQIRFDLTGPELVIFKANGERFLSFLELSERSKSDRSEKEKAERKAAREKRQREKSDRQLEEAVREAERLRQKLRDLGVDPDAPGDHGKKKKSD
jgi:Uma2 family endonuclease